MNTHEEYVTYQQAQSLKLLGFDWECRYYYGIKKILRDHEHTFFGQLIDGETYNEIFDAPTQAIACRWLREQRGNSIIILPTGNTHQYKAEVCKTWHMEWDCFPVEGQFETYEEATSAAIDYVLKIMKGDEK